VNEVSCELDDLCENEMDNYDPLIARADDYREHPIRKTLNYSQPYPVLFILGTF
jgi:hypothetical protein